MTPEHWVRVKELFGEAVARAPGPREVFLSAACAGDEELKREVEGLLRAHEAAGGFLEASVIAPPLDEEAPPIRERIGPYSILGELGHGGMGTVYLAGRADDQYTKRVAIKLVRHGADSTFVLRRFRNERQILAGLTHPNIAGLLDGGTTEDGLPYIVMEYVEGEPINTYCDSRRLSVSERIGVFRTVCGAVQYAHQNLIVHRDIKPGNILVTRDGIPKLLDFGVAKLLEPVLGGPGEEQTATQARMMTPAYASPEQIRGQSITTATDVYSLGVLLYVLLTGRRPYRLETGAPEELTRAVLEQEPSRPSTAVLRTESVPSGANGTPLTPEDVSRVREGSPERLRRRLSGDLDTIVLKALRKEPTRRYATALQLSEDLRRHLEGRTVSARRDTPWYRTRKFVARHRAGVAASLLAALAILGALGVAVERARAARRSETVARRRFEDVRGLASSLLFELNDEMEKVSGSTKARQLLVTRALEYLDRLSRDAAGEGQLTRDLAAAYLRVGDIQGGLGIANVGDSAGAIASYRRAAALWEGAVAADPGSDEARRSLAEAYQRLCEIETDVGKKLPLLDRAVAALRPAVERDPKNVPNRIALQSFLLDRADVLLYQGRSDEALSVHAERIALCEAILKDDPSNFRARRCLAMGAYKTGQALNQARRWSEAIPEFRKALVLWNDLAPSYPSQAQVAYESCFALSDQGVALIEMGRLAEALPLLEKAVATRERLVAADPANSEQRVFLLEARRLLGEAVFRSGRRAEGERRIREVVDALEAMQKADPPNSRIREVLEESRKAAKELVPGG